MQVAFLTASMSRLAGGLFDATRHLAGALEFSGSCVTTYAGADIASERDLPEWGNTPVRIGRVTGPSFFGWQASLSAALRADAPDIVHLHGLWTYPSLATLRWSEAIGRPRVISPHGMLDPWALRHSAWKKKIVTALFETRNLQGAACLHALCEAEYRAIRALGLTTPVAVIPNGVSTDEADREHPQPAWTQTLPAGALVLLFLGRIHPKKGLPELIAALGQIGDARLGAWHLVIAGWDQGGHEAELQRLVAAQGLSHRVRFIGPQFGADKSATLASADAFVLPSHSEGLPLSVLEAWAFRLPVLMTEACNLPEGFAANAAFALSMAPASMAACLAEFLNTGDSALQDMGVRGRELVEQEFSWLQIAREMKSVYTWCCSAGDRPNCVREA